mmetsp:Transcript_23360/g.51873  ORF Transcript_23360/g.51873 Transcript_23360/m.51873 type:complete len:277 (+) Transcript_23360:679-1509(+)
MTVRLHEALERDARLELEPIDVLSEGLEQQALIENLFHEPMSLHRLRLVGEKPIGNLEERLRFCLQIVQAEDGLGVGQAQFLHTGVEASTRGAEVRYPRSHADASPRQEYDLAVLLCSEAGGKLRQGERRLDLTFHALLTARLFGNAGHLEDSLWRRLDIFGEFQLAHLSPQDVQPFGSDVRVTFVAPERRIAEAQRDVVRRFFAVNCHVSCHVARAERIFAVQAQPILGGIVASLAGGFELISIEALDDPVEVEELDVRAVGLGLNSKHDMRYCI